MNDFGSIEAVWRSQDRSAAPNDAGYQRLRQSLREYAQAELRLNIAKTGGVSVLVIHFAWALATYRPAPLVAGGAALIVLSTLAFLYANWVSQLPPRALTMDLPAVAFAANTAHALRRRRRALRIAYAALILGLLAGANLIMADTVQGTWSRRGFHHSAASVFLTAAGLAGRALLERRFRRTTAPALRELENLSQSLHSPESEV